MKFTKHFTQIPESF